VSDYFSAVNGVKQGGVLSPVLVSAWSNRVCTARASQKIINSPSDVWCASRVSVGSPVIHFVHRRSDVID